ncbi:uncharacterized protein LOC110911522 isoform X2 [Helianthus annuus]|uniref:uncharacterized protein LOC110911522 isoform X2 n=1 Tax=Helianthus annuus TaxID=4232 RepID=UPI001652B8D6|nr:uncharacterized protein LOC110911522 isoform X2 [Helianthus annuus]
MNIIFAFFLFTRVQPNVFAYRDQDLQDFLTRHIDQDLQDLLHENPSVYLSLLKGMSNNIEFGQHNIDGEYEDKGGLYSSVYAGPRLKPINIQKF